MTQKPLGILEPVDIRFQWPDEAQDFTPWLASEKGLELLGNVIKADLEVIEQERYVGPFRADIIAKHIDEDEERLIVIENQFGKTNHDHLGKIVTYGAGVEAVTIVWIAENFTNEHRQALDWLNETSDGTVEYFGLQIQLLRIGNSLPAPQFRVVSSPNEWAQAAKQAGNPAITDNDLDQLKFWEELQEFAKQQKTKIRFAKPRPEPWCTFRLGRAGFIVRLNLLPTASRIRCRLEISLLDEEKAKKAYQLLEAQKQNVEQETGVQLEWNQEPGIRRRTISAIKDGISISDPQQRAQAISWLYDMAERFFAAFAQRIKSLDLSDELDGEEN
jgi:hypothetical protein